MNSPKFKVGQLIDCYSQWPYSPIRFEVIAINDNSYTVKSIDFNEVGEMDKVYLETHSD